MPPRPSDRLPRTREALRLGAFARDLACSVGVEWSCKLSPGRAEEQRFLLSYGADERTARLTLKLLEELVFPPAAITAFAADAARARFLHLGFEGGRAPVLKAYAEGGPDGPEPLYTAYKVSPTQPGFAVDDYRLMSSPPPAVALNEALADEALARPCEALLARAGETFALEVQRRGAARRSFDVRLYGGVLTVADADGVIDAARVRFSLVEDDLRILTESKQALLGHLAAGRGDSGEPFVTLYWGAEDFA